MGVDRRLSVRQQQRQQERQARRARRKARQGFFRWLALASIALLALAMVVGLMLPGLLPTGGGAQRKALSAEERAKGPGEHQVSDADYWLPGQRDYHLAGETPYTGYASTPPTYGPHWAVPARWGVYDEPIPNERQLHNLEHGGVTIQYKPGDEELATKIETLAQGLRGFPGCLLVAPHPTMEHPIAMTAWGVLLTLDEYDEDAIKEFASFYRDQGPERLNCQDMAQQ